MVTIAEDSGWTQIYTRTAQGSSFAVRANFPASVEVGYTFGSSTVPSALANGGSIGYSGTATFWVRPVANYWGNAGQITLTEFNNGQPNGGASTFPVTVSAVNDAPVANTDSGSTSEDAGVQINPLANDSDVDSTALTVTSATVTQGFGTVAVTMGGSRLQFTPGAQHQGLDSGETANVTVSYTITDGLLTSTGIVNVVVSGANDAPIIANEQVLGADNTSTAVNVLANDGDVDGEALTLTGASVDPALGTVQVQGAQVVYTPSLAVQALPFGEVLEVEVAYSVSDGTATVQGTLTIWVSGADEIIVGTNGEDVLAGTVLDEFFYGGMSDDVIASGAGRDLLDGGSGADILVGGRGDDLYLLDDAGDVVVERANEGLDRARTTVSATLAAQVEEGEAAGLADINLVGNALSNLLIGNAGANRLTGGTGNDTLIGGAGIDTLSGGAGNDEVLTGEGADIVILGAGTDSVVLLSSSGVTKVNDFNASDDTLVFDRSAFGLAADAAIEDHVVFGNVSPDADHGYFLVSGNAVRWDADGLGGIAAVVLVRLVVTGSAAVSLDDFQFL